MLGGEACAWSERVDAAVLDAKVWPDSAAAAENLWMGPSRMRTLVPLWEGEGKRRLKRGVAMVPVDGNRSHPDQERFLRAQVSH